MERINCIYCTGALLQLFTLPQMPVFMGTVPQKEAYEYHDMTFANCHGCGAVQLSSLLDPYSIYRANHNIDVIGDLWRNHYHEFANFLGPLEGKNILEISDPAAKIATLCSGYQQWTIVEPNPTYVPETNPQQQIKFIKTFFDDRFETTQQVDMIVHSHFFEHTYFPRQFLQHCWKLLNNDGVMCFTIPDMEFFLKQEYSPNSILHFEHTFYYDKSRIVKLLEATGFLMIDSCNYRNHSTFFKAKKHTPSTPTWQRYDDALNFRQLFETYLKNISRINQIIATHQNDGNSNVYLYGAHVTSQFYLFNGLDVTHIRGLLDSSPRKQGNYLYGTELLVYSPQILAIENSAVVICSHMGVYTEEIITMLHRLNQTVRCL